jgi:imidazolonepropionase-like amidohydrolase
MTTVHRIAVEGAEWGASAAAMDRAKRELDGRQRAVRAAIEMGVSVGVGSDTGGRGGFGLLTVRELSRLTECGMTPMQAITAATRTTAEALDLDSEIGTLEIGKVADLVIVEGDLLSDLSLLEDRHNIRQVVTAVAQPTV